MFYNKKLIKNKKNEDIFSIQEGKIKNGVISNAYRLNWTEEIFSFGGKNQARQLGKSFNYSLIVLIGLFFFIILSLLLSRSLYLQIVKGSYYHSMAEGNRIRIERIEAKRGIIYDRNKKPLVRNIANFLLYFIPSDLPKDEKELDKIIKKVSQISSIEEKIIYENINKIDKKNIDYYNPLFIADNIPYEKAMLLYTEEGSMPGVFLTNKTRREYDISCFSFSHILGYTGKISESELKKYPNQYQLIDYIGKMGIEYFWENELKGFNGKKNIEVDAFGKEKKIISEEPAKDGNNLILSIDSELQKKAEEVMAVNLSKLKLNKGSIIISDPNNGEILSLVSLPSYDNNIFARGIKKEEYEALLNNKDNPLFNRSISGEYPSGSTIKPIIASAALEEGIINEHTSFTSSGGIKVGQWFFPDWKAGGHGITDVRKALAQSINTFFYIIGGGYQDFKGLGADTIVKYEKLFGLSSQLGIDLPGEASGFLPTKDWKEKTTGEKWYIGNTYHLSIGQGDTLVTPLQVSTYTSYFANGGKLFRPHLVKEILSSDDKKISEIESSPIRSDIISKYNIQIVREGMRQTVTEGSARSLNSVIVPVAGKTGTAQTSGDKEPHAWFIGFAPYDNPQIAITVLIENGVEGSTVAVPIARDILNWYFSRDKKN